MAWDNKKPTAQMLGRWQPWHNGHQKLFEKILEKTGQVLIMVRDVQGVDDNPFDFDTVKQNIESALKDYIGKFKIVIRICALSTVLSHTAAGPHATRHVVVARRRTMSL